MPATASGFKGIPIFTVATKRLALQQARMIIQAYADTLLYYSGGGYRLINGYLRGDEPWNEELQAHIQNLDRIIGSNKSTSPMVLYRGISPDDLSILRTQSESGTQVFANWGYLGLTDSIGAASFFSSWQGAGALIKFYVPAGINAFEINGYSEYPEEQEFLLPRETRFRLLSDCDAFPIIEAEVLPHG